MVHNKKPHLAGIQEFGAVAYVKDLKAGKLDARAQLGWFVGYDSKSKGYRIYWPGKRSISVERNVIFNQDDVQINDGTVSISSGVQSEGEMESEKVIQYPINCVEDPKKVDTEGKGGIRQRPRPKHVQYYTFSISSRDNNRSK